ncbi:MAG TPA: NADH-quinone oxidoreductase subunit A [Verrucomicrobiales bacterium]|nr:NADH-quinone oxidoreductase subunit A [Verrucomicrobiales bacterium]HIL70035.1 NADH-quinone oxidoreductase subunit A [Verrucomicrobiota bacterium]
MESAQLVQFIPVLILALAAGGFAAGALVFSSLVGKTSQPSPIKDSAYECGMLPVGDGSARFSVKFYRVAMLFILFDIEVVFLYPWAVVYKDFLKVRPDWILVSMLVFLGIQAVGFVYELKNQAFDWQRD